MGNRFVEQLKASGVDSDAVDAYLIASIFEDTTIEDDREVAEAITTIAHEYSSVDIGLNMLLRTIEWLPRGGAAIEAAIEAQYFAEIREGVDALVACTRLSSQHPELSVQIERAVRSALTISEAAASLGMVHELPMDFGRMEHDLRPRYILEELLGSGAQGSVYLARDRRFDGGNLPAYVAVKVCRFDLNGEEEATCARAINHLNVARVVDRGIEASVPYIVYELIDGVPLGQWLEEHPHATWQERCELVAQVADGVQAAHASGVIHRDLRPSNILVRPDGCPVITDFGISCRHEDGRSYAYQTEETVLFISSEQYKRTAMGKAPTTDVYSLGGLLFWTLTGQYPNGGDVREAIDSLEAGDPFAGDRCASNPGPQRLELIWSRALTGDTTKRHRSAEQFAADLRAVVNYEPIAWIDTDERSRLRLFIRRNAVVSAVTAAALVVLVGSTWMVAGTRAGARLTRAETVIEQQKAQLETAQQYMVEIAGLIQAQASN